MVLALGLQSSRADYDAIFTQATQAEPDYKGYYDARASFLLPRWYGTEGEWVRDLTQSADRIGGEEGDLLYARVVWSVDEYDNEKITFDEKKSVSWSRVERGFETIRKRFPTSLAAMNERARLAFLAGDKAKAREYFKQTEGKVVMKLWYGTGEFTSAANWAFEN
jgi:hypothetical protein